MIFVDNIKVFENAPVYLGNVRLPTTGAVVSTNIADLLTASMAFNFIAAAGQEPVSSFMQTLKWMKTPAIKGLRGLESNWTGPQCLIPFRKLKKDGVHVNGALYMVRHLAACLAYAHPDTIHWRVQSAHIPLFIRDIWPNHHAGLIEQTNTGGPGSTIGEYIYGSENYNIAIKRMEAMSENFLTQVIYHPRTLRNILRMRGVELAGAME